MRPMFRHLNLVPTSAIFSIGIPVAKAPATIEPAEVPAMQSILIPCSAKARKTPI